MKALVLTTDLESMEVAFVDDGRQIHHEDLTMEQKRTICAMYYGAGEIMADLAAEVVTDGKKMKGALGGFS